MVDAAEGRKSGFPAVVEERTMSGPGRDKPEIFTVGHSNHTVEALLALLGQHRVEVLVDTRSSPYSRYAEQFNQQPLREAVQLGGMRYVYLGRELGGRPDGEEFYDEEGHVLYGKVSESPPFLEGINKVLQGIRRYRVALLCSEENPSGCHRRLLVTRVLAGRGVQVRHIRGDGRLQSEEDLRREEEEARGEAGQLSLFEPEEVTEWRSVRSVLDRRPPRPSSEY